MASGNRPEVTLGVDTHLDTHVGVAVDAHPVVLGVCTVAATALGARELIVVAPDNLRDSLQPLPLLRCVRRCVALRPGRDLTLDASIRRTLRLFAKRWEHLSAELKVWTSNSRHSRRGLRLDSESDTGSGLIPRRFGSPREATIRSV